MHRMVSLLASLAICLSVATAAAQGDTPATPTAGSGQSPVFGIQVNPPTTSGYFLVDLKPGETAALDARVVTVDSMPLDLRTYATNALSLVNGGFGAGPETDALDEPASWLSFPPQAFTLGTNDHIDIPFSVSVPSDTAPGQYIAALVVQTDGPLAIGGTTAFNQVIRSAMPVVVNVPGPWTVQFDVGAPGIVAEVGNARIVIPVTNGGTAFVHLEGQVLVSKEDGTPIIQAPISMGSVYAGTATTIEINLSALLAFGTYVVSGTLADANSGTSITIEPTAVTYAQAAEPAPVTFTLDPVAITPVGDPIQFAGISLTIDNGGEAIPTGTVVLKVSKDGAPVEEYVLARNQAMPAGTSSIEDRYIPVTGWQRGTYTFEIEVMAIDASGVSTVVFAAPLDDTVVVP